MALFLFAFFLFFCHCGRRFRASFSNVGFFLFLIPGKDMKSCADCMKKYGWLFTLLFLISLLYPLVMFSELLWVGSTKVFSTIEQFSKEYKYSIQLLQVFGIFGVILAWWIWKKDEEEKEKRSLSSISFVDVEDNGVATIQNTSSSSILNIKVCRPDNFEKSIGSKTFLEYAVNSEKTYKERVSFFQDTSNWKFIHWENILKAKLFIGEKTSFHIKNVADEDGEFVHFAPIEVEIFLEGKDFESGQKSSKKHVLFRYVSKKCQGSIFLGKDKYHPYGKWIRLM